MVEKDLVNYSAPQVRVQSVLLLRVIIDAKSGLPVKKLFSPLATLSADHEQSVPLAASRSLSLLTLSHSYFFSLFFPLAQRNVRLASVTGFGDIARATSDHEVLDMVVSQLHAFLNSSSYSVIQQVLRTFIEVIPVAESSFRDSCEFSSNWYFVGKCSLSLDSYLALLSPTYGKENSV